MSVDASNLQRLVFLKIQRNMIATKRMTHSCRNFGFSLVELLSVIGIVTVVAAASLPMVASMTKAQNVNSGVQIVGGVLDQARQYAISKNTYVWVVFNMAATNDPSDYSSVAILASKSGADSLDWATTKLSFPGTVSPASDLELVGKVRNLASVRFGDAPTVSIGSLPTETAVAFATVDIDIVIAGATHTFTKAIQFTPTGEARMSDALNRYMDLALLPLAVPSHGEAPNQAVIRVGGITGKTNIYRN